MESGRVSDGSGGMHQLSEVRLVLLGVKASGKSSTGNTLMGAERFKLQESSKCVKRKENVAGNKITVVEAPGWTRNKAILAKQEIVLSVVTCSPGPHAVLLVMRLDNKSWVCGKKAFRACIKLLQECVWSHSIVTFTFGDTLGDTSIEQYIECGGSNLQWLVEKCGNRYHVFNNKNSCDSNNVMEFLEKLEKMVAENQGGYL